MFVHHRSPRASNNDHISQHNPLDYPTISGSSPVANRRLAKISKQPSHSVAVAVPASTGLDDDDDDVEPPPQLRYNQQFKFRFGRLCELLRQYDKTEATFQTVDDIDFVFVVEKESVAVLEKVKNYFRRLNKKPQITSKTIEQARLIYLNNLTETFRVNWTKRESARREYYLIQLPFQHLGLMMQLLGYRWALRTDKPNRTAYKTFYFQKRNKIRYHEYQLEEESRASFADRWRYDLTYNFLLGATERMEDIMEQAIHRANNSDITAEARAQDDTVEFYSFMRLFADGIFNDWMVLHDQRHFLTDEEVTARYEAFYQKSGGCSNCCHCGHSCFPAITCQRYVSGDHNDRKLLSNHYGKNSRKTFGEMMCTVWRSFWFRNLIDCKDYEFKAIQDDNGPRLENGREYFARVGALANAFSLKSVPSPTLERRAKMRHLIKLDALKNYFGEKIGFYFGFMELLIISLVLPAFIGIAIFLGGVGYYGWEVYQLSGTDKSLKQPISYVFSKACDNYATPAFAAIMVIWGTTFYELWMRREKWYGFSWQVEKLENTELERAPEYSLKCVSKLRKIPGGAIIAYIPSFLVTLFFIVLVFASVYFINIVKIFAMVYCPKSTEASSPENASDSQSTTTHIPGAIQSSNSLVDMVACNLFSAAPVLANSISMFILDKVFTEICYWLTDFEGHATQSKYTDSLIFKLFIFRFFDYYLVLFYIAFGVSTKAVKYPPQLTGGKQYEYNQDFGCGQQPCMAFLTRQLLSVIVTSPFLNSILAVVLPLFRRIYLTVRDGRHQQQVSPVVEGGLSKELESQFKLVELSTLDRKEFTAQEYTDKIIVYGALVMFSVALPPAPLLAILIMRLDFQFDLGRMMTAFRRPMPTRVQDIGMWGSIVNFLTYAGIVTNPLIVVLTSEWGSTLTVWEKFIVFLVCEHVVFLIRMLVAFAVPDVPKSLIRQQQIHKLVKDEIQAEQHYSIGEGSQELRNNESHDE